MQWQEFNRLAPGMRPAGGVPAAAAPGRRQAGCGQEAIKSRGLPTPGLRRMTASQNSATSLDFVRFALDEGVLRFGSFKVKSGRISP